MDKVVQHGVSDRRVGECVMVLPSLTGWSVGLGLPPERSAYQAARFPRAGRGWLRDSGRGGKLVLLEQETGREGQSATQALRG